MKKILNLTIICLCLLSSVFIFNGCNTSHDKDIARFTVTEKEWNEALKLSVVDKVKITGDIKDENEELLYTTIYAKDRDILLYVQVIDNLETKEYYSKEDNNTYSYSQNDDVWVRTDIEQSDYEEKLSYFDWSYNYSDFLYNDKTKAYEHDFNGTLVQLYFKNGKLLKCVANLSNGNMQIFTMEYSNINLELPTIS